MRVKRAGIYRIINIINNKRYVGSSVDLVDRWNKHRYRLRRGNHHSLHLQNAWKKYGEDAFIYETLEECEPSKEILLQREQYYLDLLKPEYNILRIAGSNLGKVVSDETRRKLSDRGKGRTCSEEARKKMSEAKIGNRNASGLRTDESKLKMSEVKKGKPGPKHTAETKCKIGKITTERWRRKRKIRLMMMR